MSPAKLEWKPTPFETVAQGRIMAERLELRPGPVEESDTHRFFYIFSKKRRTIIARAMKDGVPVGPVLEQVTITDTKRDPFKASQGIPIWTPDMRLEAGMWIESEHQTLTDVRVYWGKQFINPENLEILKIDLYRIDDDEYEYGTDKAGRVWERVLTPGKKKF